MVLSLNSICSYMRKDAGRGWQRSFIRSRMTCSLLSYAYERRTSAKRTWTSKGTINIALESPKLPLSRCKDLARGGKIRRLVEVSRGVHMKSQHASREILFVADADQSQRAPFRDAGSDPRLPRIPSGFLAEPQGTVVSPPSTSIIMICLPRLYWCHPREGVVVVQRWLSSPLELAQTSPTPLDA